MVFKRKGQDISVKDGEEAFISNVLVQDGVIRQLSIIGEAAGKLPAEAKNEYNEVPWKDIIGMRNIIIHDYSDISIKRIWNTVERDIESLEKVAQKMLVP